MYATESFKNLFATVTDIDITQKSHAMEHVYYIPSFCIISLKNLSFNKALIFSLNKLALIQ